MDPRQLQLNKFELLHALRMDVAEDCKRRKMERIQQKAANRKQGKTTLTPRKAAPVRTGEKWLTHAEKKQAESKLNELMDAFAYSVVTQAPMKRFDGVIAKLKDLARTIPRSDVDFADEVEIFENRVRAFVDRITNAGIDVFASSATSPSSSREASTTQQQIQISPDRHRVALDNESAGFVSPISPSQPTPARGLVSRNRDTSELMLSPITSPDNEFELSKSTVHPPNSAPPIAPSPAPRQHPAVRYSTLPSHDSVIAFPPPSVAGQSLVNHAPLAPIHAQNSCPVSTSVSTSFSMATTGRSPEIVDPRTVNVSVSVGNSLLEKNDPAELLSDSGHSLTSSRPEPYAMRDAAVQNDDAVNAPEPITPQAVLDVERYEREKLLLELRHMELEMSHARAIAQDQLNRVRQREVQRAQRIIEDTEKNRVFQELDVQEDGMRREIASLKTEIDSVSSMLKSQLEITRMLLHPHVNQQQIRLNNNDREGPNNDLQNHSLAQLSSNASSGTVARADADAQYRKMLEVRAKIDARLEASASAMNSHRAASSLSARDDDVEPVPPGASRTTVTTTITTTTTSTPVRGGNSNALLHAQALSLAASQPHVIPLPLVSHPPSSHPPSSSFTSAHVVQPLEQLSAHMSEDDPVATLDASTDISRLLDGFRSGHLSDAERRALIARAKSRS